MDFTPAERRIIARLNTPAKVQRWLNRLPYNSETGGETFRSFRQVLRHRTAHCSEAALLAACVLEQHGYPPLLLTLESADYLDHVLFAYRVHGRWGTVARSRDPGLHGRKPVFRSPRALAESYCDPYIDYTGMVKGYSVVSLDVMGSYDWRFSPRNVWAVEKMLLDIPQLKIVRSKKRARKERKRYAEYRKRHNDKKPLYYRGREKWTEIPKGFL
jgi:hypothetical protein